MTTVRTTNFYSSYEIGARKASCSYKDALVQRSSTVYTFSINDLPGIHYTVHITIFFIRTWNIHAYETNLKRQKYKK